MTNTDIILRGLQKDIVSAAKFKGLSKPPTEFLVVVNRYGEPISSDAASRTLNARKAHEFSVRLGRWLGEESTRLMGANVRDARASMEERIDIYFNGQLVVFTSLEEAAIWYSRPGYVQLDAYDSYFITSGLPIYSLSIWKDRP